MFVVPVWLALDSVFFFRTDGLMIVVSQERDFTGKSQGCAESVAQMARAAKKCYTYMGPVELKCYLPNRTSHHCTNHIHVHVLSVHAV